MRMISVILPALNEEAAIGQTINDIPIENLIKDGYDVEVIVVDGGSEDRTVEIARKHGAKVIIAKRGYGRQYQQGFCLARGEIIVTADSDGSYPMFDIVKFIKILQEKKVDFITVNRFAEMSPGAMRIINRIGNILLTWVTNFLFKMEIKDSQSGMWIFRKEILNIINLTGTGMPFSEEIKIESFKKVKSCEIPGSYKKRIGQVKLKVFFDGWDNLIYLVKKRFSKVLY